MPEVLEVLEGGGGDEARRVPRWIRFCAYGAATAVALWYALDALDAGLARDTAPSLPRPPGPVLANAPVSALVTLDDAGPPSGTVVARLGPGESWRRVALGGTLMEVPAGVDPCAVPADPDGDRAVLQQVWLEGLSRPGLRARDLTGAPHTVPDFEELLGYRDISVWTMDALTPDTEDASVRVRDGAAAPSEKVTAIELAWRSAVSRWPVAVLDTAAEPGAPGGALVTGVLFSDAADPTLIQVDGHQLHVEWPGMLGTGFHVERVLGFGRDTVVALDGGPAAFRVDARGEVLRTPVRLPEGWTVPDPPNTGQLAFTGDGFVQVVRSRDGNATALVRTDPRTGRSRIVPGSAGAGAVVASGNDVLFLVRGETGATRTAYWDASGTGQARFLTETETAPSTRLVCALGEAD